jgi:peptidoglycan/LPS O-acetylase OafA/YrhL
MARAHGVARHPCGPARMAGRRPCYSRSLPDVGFRPDINGLRAIAVICVVLYHFDVRGFDGGFVGVDVFFVISGFLMTHAVMSKLTAGTFTVVDFYTARARRIVPALAAVCLVLLAVGSVLLLPIEFATLARQTVTALTFTSNVVFWRERGYFDGPSQEKFLLHTWSLSVEWQFYLLFPLLVLALFRWLGPRGVRVVLGAGAVLTFALNIVLTHFKPEAAFFLFPPRAWELLTGSLVYLAGDRLKSRVLAPLGLAGIAAATVFYDDSLAFPGAWALVPVGGAAAIIAAQGQAWFLTNRPMQFLGDTSYSLYLVHWPLVVWLRRDFQKMSPLVVAGLIAASLVLAYASYRFVETPFRKRGDRAAPVRTLLSHLAPAAGVALIAAAVWGLGGIPGRVPSIVAANEAAALDSGNPEDCRMVDGVCHLGPVGGPQILFWGDSHMAHLYGALLALEPRATASGREILMAVDHGCLPVRGFSSQNHVHCDERVERVWKLAQSPKVEAVAVASIWTPYFRSKLYDLTSRPTVCAAGNGTCRPFASAEEALPHVESRLAEDVKTLVALGKRVYLVLPVPAYMLPVPRVLALEHWRGLPTQVSLSRAKHEEAQRMLTDMLRSVAKRTGARVIDPTDVYCPGDACLASRDGVSIYRDNNHLTSAGARLLAPALEAVLSPN